MKELVATGAIGDLRVVSGYFSYFNRDPKNIRNRPEMGGGALMDIGCYPITLSRMLFGSEPQRVMGSVERDPEMKTDRLTSAILEFDGGQATFTCSTQLVPFQTMHVLGTHGRLEIEIPFNAPPDRPTRILVNDAWSEIPVCDQYTLQGDLFSRAILDDTEVPVPLEDALRNMAVIEAIFRAGKNPRFLRLRDGDVPRGPGGPPHNSDRICSRRNATAAPGPIRMEKLAARFVNPLVGVRAEKVALGL